jgi:esterase/lipase superfamily enzyme
MCWLAQPLLAALLMLGTGCGAKGPRLAAAPNLYTQSETNPYEAVPQELRTTMVSVVYATDRQGETEEGTFKYSAERCRETSFGVCTVQMGEADTTWDELVQASRTSERAKPLPLAVTSIDERGRYPAQGPAVNVAGRWTDDPVYLAKCEEKNQALHATLSEQLAKTPRKELIIFVHGYNNSFDSAAFRAAQLWHFAGRGGVPVMFSWPAGSSGILQGYTRDRESGEFANPHLKHFLRTLASCSEVQKIHLVAHSRGTDVLATAIRELHIECRGGGKDTRTELKLGQMILAAPDIDLDVFIERFSEDRLGFVPERLTIYASPGDKAIGLSNWLFGSRRRIGQVMFRDLGADFADAAKHHPVMSVVDVRAETDKRGHGYFLSSPAALSDVILVLRDQRAPGAEHGRPLNDSPHGFWELRDGYPVPH